MTCKLANHVKHFFASSVLQMPRQAFFFIFDTNQDNMISRSEFIALVNVSNGLLSSADLNSTFNLIDVNGDSQITWNEVYQFNADQLPNTGFRAVAAAPRSFYSKNE